MSLYVPETLVAAVISADQTPEIVIGWNSVSHAGTYTAKRYDIYRGAGTKTKIEQCALLANTTALTFTDTAIVIGATYTYFVVARMAGDTTDFISNALTTTIPLGLRWVYGFSVGVSNQLRVVDMLDPTAPVVSTPTIVGVSNQAAFQVEVDSDNIYLGLTDKIYILRWADTPATPVLLSTIAWFAGCFIVEHVGGHVYLYASNTDGGTNVGNSSWDITNPASPVSLGFQRTAAGIINILNPYRAMVMDPSRNLWTSWTSNNQGAVWTKIPVSALGILSAAVSSVINAAIGSPGVYAQFIQDSVLWNWNPATVGISGYPLPPVAPYTYVAAGTGTTQIPWIKVRSNQVLEAQSPAVSGVPPVRLHNFTNPANVVQLSGYGSNLQAAPGAVACGNQLAYFNLTDGKFYCYDITNPASPVLKNTGGTTMASMSAITYLAAYMPDFFDGRNGVIIT